MSNAINTSGSMLVQLSVDNSAGELLPGSFASVSFAIARAAGTLSIPPSAMIFGKAGLRVATVGPVVGTTGPGRSACQISSSRHSAMAISPCVTARERMSTDAGLPS